MSVVAFVLTFICPCMASISLKYKQKDATFSRSIYFYKLLYTFQVVTLPIIRSTKLYIQYHVLSTFHLIHYSSKQQYWFDNTWRCIRVMCYWWWAEEPTETCRVIYRNKQIEKTLHLVGCTLEILLHCLSTKKGVYFLVIKHVFQHGNRMNCISVWIYGLKIK
jgi:hypothetical protein